MGGVVQTITLTMNKESADFEKARAQARLVAEKVNPEAEIISWHNRDAQTQSPCCLGCEFDDAPAWEVYGRNHGGRLKIVVNDGQYVFIVS